MSRQYPPHPFDLDQALATWRQFVRRNRAMSPSDVEELEVHLLDTMEDYEADGMNAEAAFRRARQRLGAFDELEGEYDKVRFGRTKRSQSMIRSAGNMLEMVQTFIRSGMRSFKRHAGYTAINLVGLAVGLAAVLLISLFVVDELRFDTQHRDAERIYRLGNATTGWPYGRLIAETYPEVEALTYLRSYPGMSIKHEGRYVYRNLRYADAEFLPMFDFPLLAGDRTTALAAPYSAVVTDQLAIELFGTVHVLGQNLVMNDSLDVTITGVTPVPSNSHIEFELLVSLETLFSLDPNGFQRRWEEGWLDLNAITYMRLTEGADAKALALAIKTLPEEKAGDILRQWGVQYQLTMHPLTDIYLDPDVSNALGPSSSIRFVYLLSAIAAFLLILAIVNFVNLSTARSVERAREVGIRKVAGSSRKLLIAQFMSEALLMTGMATALAVLVAAAVLPVFNELSDKSFHRMALLDPGLLLALLGAVVIVGLMAGTYPALVLSRFLPVRVLKGRLDASRSGMALRRTLVVFQFAVSATIILGTLLVNNQVRFMQTADLGFDGDQVLVIDARQVPTPVRRQNMEILRSRLTGHAGAVSLTSAVALPGRSGWRGQLSFPEGWDADRSVSLEYIGVDPWFVETIGLKLVAGRDFDPASGLDARQSVIINEAAVREVGWESPQEAIGKRFSSPGSGKPEGVVIGVVRDYHHHGLQEDVASIMYGISTSGGLLALRFQPEQAEAVLGYVGETWQKLLPEYTYETMFLDDDFVRQYAQENRLRRISGAFSILAIVIACLGLFGLVAYETSRRTKEIGIRKVLGASTVHIVVLLTRQVVALVAIGYLLAIPVVWLGIRSWKSSFAYSAPVSVGWIVAGGAILIAFAIFTAGQQAVRAAVANPSQSIRSE